MGVYGYYQFHIITTVCSIMIEKHERSKVPCINNADMGDKTKGAPHGQLVNMLNFH